MPSRGPYHSGIRSRLDVILAVPDKSPSSFARLNPVLTTHWSGSVRTFYRAWIEALGYVLFFGTGVLLGIVVSNLTARD